MTAKLIDLAMEIQEINTELKPDLKNEYKNSGARNNEAVESPSMK